MKTLRYIILLVAIVIIQKPLSAQTLASDPSMTTFRSTSTMPMSGSPLISSYPGNSGVVLRASKIDHDDEESERDNPGDPDYDPDNDPLDNPVGAVPLLLMTLLAVGYGVGKSKVE